MSLSLVTGPTVEPLTLDLIKLQLRIEATSTAEDDLLVQYRQAARERGENATGRAFSTQTWDRVMDEFPRCGWLELPKPPLRSVTWVKYRDGAGTLQTLGTSLYVVEAPAGSNCMRGKVSLAYGQTWPTTYGQAGDVSIRFVCGYTTNSFPAILRSAMLLDIAMLYRQREQVITGTIVAPLPGGAADIYRRFVSYGTERRVA